MRVVVQSALFALLAPVAAAQSFNLDVGDNLILFPAPANSYAGAAGQAGVWNAVAHPYSVTLTNLDGTPSSVTTSSTSSSSFSYFPSTLTGDDYNFMVDTQDLPAFSGPYTWTFSGLINGDYAVYTYAWAPENSGNQTRVTVPGALEAAQDIGGLWFGSPHVQGVTYALHHVTVTNSTLTVQVEGLNLHDGTVNGFQLVDLTGLPTTYCTAKVNSVGCSPAIAYSGSPSASAGSGFTISASSVLNNKNGLLFYSEAGPAAIAFQGGTLCCKPPIRRTAVQASHGNPPPNDCSGSLSFDFNAFIALGVDPQLAQGQQVNAQYWYRDPGFNPPNNTGLSDALQFVIGF